MSNNNVRIKISKSRSIKRYHTTECRRYPEDGRDIPLSEAKHRDLTECRFCSGEYEPHASDDPMKYVQWALAND